MLPKRCCLFPYLVLSFSESVYCVPNVCLYSSEVSMYVSIEFSYVFDLLYNVSQRFHSQFETTIDPEPSSGRLRTLRTPRSVLEMFRRSWTTLQNLGKAQGLQEGLRKY
jgi:hypothetical protein